MKSSNLIRNVLLPLALVIPMTGWAGNHGHNMAQGMKAMQHANPMPNLMKIVVKNQDALQITAEQDKVLSQWRKDNKSKSWGRVHEIVSAEEALIQSSLAGKSWAEMEKDLNAILENRRALAEQKTRCRDMLRKTLTPQQYDKVIALYRESIDTPNHAAAGDIHIMGAWAKQSLGKGGNSASFMTIRNLSDKDNKVVAAKSDVAKSVELHTHIKEGNMMRMRKLEGGIPLPANGNTELKPGGLHVMFIGLTRDLNEGDSFPLTLVFEHGPEVTVTLPVKSITHMPKGHHGMHH